jgi:transcriptional regulator with XRE-family HTH domain
MNNHLSYTDIANKTGLSISHVSRVLRRKKNPSLHTLLALSKAMDIPTDKLIRKLGLRINVFDCRIAKKMRQS